jgi:tetratricopeptide (TPR) repeat protein
VSDKDGIIEGVVGGGEAETQDADSQSGIDPIAAALATNAAATDETIAPDLKDYLNKQARLVEIQSEHLHEQRKVLLSNLKLRRWIDRLKLGVQLFIILAATVIGLGFAVMIFDAFRSNSVVVETFDTPPALAARGLTGKVVASSVLDALTHMQASTRTSAEQRQLANAWTRDIKVEVPETGVSIGEINRLLKVRFGHDIHIEGDLVQTDTGGLVLTIRGDGVPPKPFPGAAGELDKLTTQAAEYVYSQEQPGLFAVYVMNAGRNAEAIAFIKQAYDKADPSERPYLLNTWGIALQNTGADARSAARYFREAIRLKPDFWIGYLNLQNSDLMLGDEEGAWRLGQAMIQKAGGRPGRAPELDYENLDLVTWNLLPYRDALVADLKAHGGVGANVTSEAPAIADIDVRLHDPADAELQLQTAQSDAWDPSVDAMAHFIHGRLAAEAGDTARAAAEMEAFQAAYASPIVSSNYPGYACWIAPAEEFAGHPDKADAVLNSAGRYVDCYRFRGDILDHRGDWAGAQKAYASSVAIAPDLPAGYYSWGVALARHGDLAGAEAKLSAAHARGPRWADPLKAWGDLLARQGRWREALAKYDEAQKDAPAWTALSQARAEAQRRAGRPGG